MCYYNDAESFDSVEAFQTPTNKITIVDGKALGQLMIFTNFPNEII